jgi:hypothetical protein
MGRFAGYTPYGRYCVFFSGNSDLPGLLGNVEIIEELEILECVELYCRN